MTKRVALITLVLAWLVTACASAAPPLAPRSATPSQPPASAPPDQPVATSPIQDPGDPAASGGPLDPSRAKLVLPQPGQLNVHPVGIEKISARADGRHVVLNAQWWSGVEPCAVLDSTAFHIDGSTITISVREGSGKGEVACIDIALLKVTVIDLGELDAGVYTVVADQGTAPPLKISLR